MAQRRMPGRRLPGVATVEPGMRRRAGRARREGRPARQGTMDYFITLRAAPTPRTASTHHAFRRIADRSAVRAHRGIAACGSPARRALSPRDDGRGQRGRRVAARYRHVAAGAGHPQRQDPPRKRRRAARPPPPRRVPEDRGCGPGSGWGSLWSSRRSAACSCCSPPLTVNGGGSRSPAWCRWRYWGCTRFTPMPRRGPWLPNT